MTFPLNIFKNTKITDMGKKSKHYATNYQFNLNS